MASVDVKHHVYLLTLELPFGREKNIAHGPFVVVVAFVEEQSDLSGQTPPPPPNPHHLLLSPLRH